MKKRRSSQKKYGGTAYKTLEEAISDPRVDGVYIALTADRHYEYMKKIIAMHKPILCEKPFTVNADEAKEIFELAKKEGVTRTLYNRVCVIEGLYGESYKERKKAERKARNAPIQGTSADIAKIAMLRLDDGIEEMGLDARIVLQIHDEIVVECRKEDVSAVAELMKECMTDSFDDFRVPLTVTISQGNNLALKE